jgi:predicted GNAT family acetyltransferase
MTSPFTDNMPKGRFEYTLNGLTVFANYRRDGSTLYIDYVEAPPELRGTGAAGNLMQHIVDLAQKESLKVVPICGYAAAWISRYATGEK